MTKMESVGMNLHNTDYKLQCHNNNHDHDEVNDDNDDEDSEDDYIHVVKHDIKACTNILHDV